jgi:4'-phosphopantetheinyl transferase
MDDDAHVWVAGTEGGRLSSYESVLSAPERARMGRFHFERDRRSFAVAHGLLRNALTWCLPEVPATGWEFARGPYGRPELADGQAGSGLRFNVSHCHRLVAVVVTREIDCGIDVEPVDPEADVAGLGHRILAPDELAAVMALPVSRRSARFFCHWTLKEAYAKARGQGMRLPFDRVSFDLGDGIRAAIDPELGDSGSDWQFEQWFPGPDEPLALALRAGPGRRRRVVPHFSALGA